MKDTAMRRSLDNLDILHLLWGAKVLKFLHRKITLLNMLFNFLLPLFPSSLFPNVFTTSHLTYVCVSRNYFR